MRKTITMLLAMMLTFAFGSSALAQDYSNWPLVPSDDYLPLPSGSYSSYTSTGGQNTTPRYEDKNQNIGYIKDGSQATYKFYCLQDAYYDLAMAVHYYNPGTIEVIITDIATNTQELKEEVTVPSVTNYTASRMELQTPVKKGAKQMVLNFKSSQTGYVMNYRDLTLLKRADVETGATKYSVTTSLSIPEAGTIKQAPSGEKVEEGTMTQFTVVPNFGYKFVQWNDANGQMVSAENPYTMTVNSDVTLTAVMQQVNIYSLDVKTVNANDAMITITPDPQMVNGTMMYEEGTKVSLTASENEAVSFGYWSDGSTNKTLNLEIKENTTVTANYVAGDYLFAIDFSRGAGSVASYDADLYSTSENNEAQLYLRNFDTGVVGGRNFSVLEDNKARIWSTPVNYAFELKFNTENFVNLKVKCSVWYNYNYWEKVQGQYSLDGTNWVNVGDQITMSSTETPHEWTLPTACEHQKTVMFRLLPDVTSALVGTASDYRPMHISNIYVFGKEEAYNDGKAPQIVSTVPQNNGTGASATGRVVLTFDKKVYATDRFAATLNGNAIAGSCTGTTAIFPYSALNYNTQYELILAKGSVQDAAGNVLDEPVSVTFTTMERKQPTMRRYDAVVAKDGTGDYTTIGAALDAAPSNRTEPWLIFIKEGTYEEELNVTKPFMSLIGEGRDKVFITYYGVSGGTPGDDMKQKAEQLGIKYIAGGNEVFAVHANDFFAEGVTFENSYGYKINNGPQAHAIKTYKDRAVFNRVEMRSYQDTWHTNTGIADRAYIKDSWITGSVDFIYGKGDVYFDTDTLNINRDAGGYIVAPNHDASTKWGYVFMNTDITTTYTKNPADYQVWLGRPWHGNPKTVFIHTKMELTPYKLLWAEKMGGLPALWAVYDFTDKDGNPRSTESRLTYWALGPDGTFGPGEYDTKTSNNTYNDSGQLEYKWTKDAKNSLTADEVAQYTIANVLRGTDAWVPEQIVEATATPVVSQNAGVLSWSAVPYAISYVIFKDGKAYDFTTDTSYATTEIARYSVRAANEYGSLSAMSNTVTTDVISGIASATTAAPAATSKTYNLGGQRVTESAHGVVIKGGKKQLNR